MKIRHEFINVDPRIDDKDEFPIGVYDVVSSKLEVTEDAEGKQVFTFQHRVSLKYTTPRQKVVDIHPATETNVTHG